MSPRDRSARAVGARRKRKDQRHAQRARRPLVNAIAREVGRPGELPQAGARRASVTMPEAIRERFISVRNVYYFPGGGRAFVDRDDQLTTRSEHRAVIESLVAIAQARGWSRITITGTDRFRQQAWLAARLCGLAVADYRPEHYEQARLARARARRARQAPAAPLTRPAVPARVSISSAKSPVTSPASSPPWPPERRQAAAPEWRGRLIDHGPAPYQHDASNGASYFVKLETPQGEQTIWGVDLQRALRASLTRVRPGDAVVVRRVGRDPVTARAGADVEGGGNTTAPPRQRNRYVIEQRDFFEERATLAHLFRDSSVSAQVATHRYPQLTAPYLQLRAAQLAARRLAHPADQGRFVHLVRRGMVDSIARGEPLSTVTLRARTGARDLVPERTERAAAPARD